MNNSWLELAYYHAERSKGITGKNPPVGCVIINKDIIVGVGSTSKNGRPHAEENALTMAGKKSNGGTLYVTLEPCHIKGNENSCTNQIIKAGIKRVVIGMLDPNKKTFKRGFKQLIKEGIEIEVVSLSFEHFLFYYSHYCFHVIKRPNIALKLATSADNKITYSDGTSKWITSILARKHVHQIRSLYNTVLVGSKTFKKDNPVLNARILGFKTKTVRVILDTKLSISKTSKLVNTSSRFPLIIFTAEKNSKKRKYLENKGILIISVNKEKNGILNLKEVVNQIYLHGINNILVEGGSKVASTFLNQDFIDIIYIYKSSNFIGKEGLDSMGSLKLNKNFSLYNEIDLEDNRIEIWINKNINKEYRKLKCLQELPPI